ncbi:kinase-like domain-containing protein, partial [Baffinella frigidus]
METLCQQPRASRLYDFGIDAALCYIRVTIMETLRKQPRACRLYDFGIDAAHCYIATACNSRATNRCYDFGVDAAHCYIATAWYLDSLKAWRVSLPPDALASSLPLLLTVGAQLAAALCDLHDAGVVHHDLKCDNVLRVPRGLPVIAGQTGQTGQSQTGQSRDEGGGEEGGGDPGFDIVLCDFGESKVYGPDEDGYTTRNRGTEFMKSPEMLTVANASSKERSTYDRRKKVGANKSCDVWGFACLLYELLTAQFLFFDDDWIRFFIRVTSSTCAEDLLPKERLAPLLAAPGGALVVELLRTIFVRDPIRRPSMHDVSALLEN